MSKAIIGVTVNGIEEECKWDKPRACPRHAIHKGQPVLRVNFHHPDFVEPAEQHNPMAIFDEAYDENLELNESGFVIDDEETLNDLGHGEADRIEVSAANGYALIKIFHPKGHKHIINTLFDVEEHNNYMSLQQLQTILENN